MRAISRLSLLDGISTSSLAAMMPLRMRVRKSAMGSVIDMRLPTRLRHAGDVALVRQLAQADSAQAELAVHRARTAAAAAARVGPGLVLRRAVRANDLGCLSHGSGSSLGSYWLLGEGLEVARAAVAGERHAERVEQRERLRVGRGRRGDRDVEAAHLVDRVVVDLGEDDLLPDAHVVVPATVEGARVEAAEVAQARDRDRHEAIDELVRALAAQRDRQADGHAFAQLERSDRLAGAADVRLLAGDVCELALRRLEHLRVLLGLADAHVERHLDQLGRLHVRRISKFIDEGRADLVVVAVLESCHQSSSAPEARVTRTRLPCSLRVMPRRVGFLVFGSTIATLDTWIGPSFSITPICRLGRPGTGR